ALVRTAEEYGAPIGLVEHVVASNDRRKKAMSARIIEACGGTIKGKTIAVLGVTFKPNTDDMRDSPSLDIIPALQAAGAEIRAFDPEGMKEAKELLSGVTWCQDAYEAMEGADALTVLTEWNEFRALDTGRMKKNLNAPVIVDLRNIYNPAEMKDAGFSYSCIGRPDSAFI
ncbi:MAG: UDP-glucose/GDP-mannose dehydrogenase family protein, partial [Rhodospirillaceae bacterium]|nr:UDP-glucose/GDP-mannose dehydrogenase family protein [Rhodospirillaceae bacterium]